MASSNNEVRNIDAVDALIKSKHGERVDRNAVIRVIDAYTDGEFSKLLASKNAETREMMQGSVDALVNQIAVAEDPVEKQQIGITLKRLIDSMQAKA